MTLAREVPEWTVQGVCGQTDPELFFPPKGGSSEPAKRVCRSCPVIAQCLEWAIEARYQGVWGGTTERERDVIRRDRWAAESAKHRRRRSDKGAAA